MNGIPNTSFHVPATSTSRLLLLACVAAMAASMALAQTAPATPAQGKATQSTAAPGTPPAQAAPEAPRAKPQPQAKTQEEYKAFQQAYIIEDPAAAEKAADEFAAKYKDSEVRSLLYHRLMTMYQNANNAEKTIEMGRRVLAFDPTNPVAMVTVATVLAERTRETDLDRDQRLAEAMGYAQKALQNVDTGLLIPPGTPPAEVDAAKRVLTSMAWAAMGTVELARSNYPAAEADLRKSVDINNVQPDAVTWLRLAVVLDHQKKYAEAIPAANKALELSPTGSPQATLAQQERDRLAKLTGSTAPATPAAAPAAAPTPPPTPK